MQNSWHWCQKGVKMALYGMECIDLMDDVIKILDIYFSSNKKLEQEKSFLNHIVKIQNILKLWKPRNLTIEGGIVVFKLLAISKLIHPALVTEIPTSTISLLTKKSTLCNDHENGGLKNNYIFSKVVSLQCSWIKKVI